MRKRGLLQLNREQLEMCHTVIKMILLFKCGRGLGLVVSTWR